MSTPNSKVSLTTLLFLLLVPSAWGQKPPLTLDDRWGMRWTRNGAQALVKLRLWILRYGETWFDALNSAKVQLTKA